MVWTKEEKREILKHLTAMVLSLGGEADGALFLGYAIGLDGLTVAQVKQACARAIRTCKYLPKPAELRELAGEVSIEHRATLAWDGVKKAIACHSGYRSVSFDDKAIHAAINSIGGWPYVCEQTTVVLDRDMWPRFLRVYKAVAARGSISSADAGPLLGLFSQDATLRGHRQPEVIAVDTGLGTQLAISGPDGDGSRPALPSAAARIGVIEP